MNRAAATILARTGLAAAVTAALFAGCASQPGAGGSTGTGITTQTGSFAIVDGERVTPVAIPMGDPATIERILDEGRNHNRVMDHLAHLSRDIGPRLTGSSNVEEANKWARDKFESWGLSNAHLFEWGEISMRFDRLPSSAKVYVETTRTDDDGNEVVQDRDLREMAFTWLAWAPGTDGPVRGPAVPMPRTVEEFEAVSDQIPGAWMMLRPNYEGRRGIRGIGGSMRARQTYFAEIRERMAAGEFDAPPAPPDAADAGEGGLGGTWNGTMTGPRAPDGIPFFAKFTRDDAGTIAGEAGIAGYRVSEMGDASYDEATKTLTFTWESSSGPAPITLRLNDAGKFVGDLPGPEGGDGYAIELTRESAEEAAQPDTEDYVTALVLGMEPAGFLSSSKDERVWTTSADGWRELTTDTLPVDIEAAVSEPDFDFIMARLDDGMPVMVEMDMACEMIDGPIPVYNTIAEIRGTEKPDEIVIVSAHLDSWNGPGSMGTTDNGTGSAVTMEAARLLRVAGARPKRTIRFVLWTGEEQGLLGSRAYVEGLGDELDRISAVFVDDGGTNYEGGLQCIAPMADYLAAATAPVNGQFYSETDALNNPDDPDAGWMNVNVQINERMPRGGGSDHASFNQAGVPGFFWDEVGRAEYRKGWHTQHDRLDLAIPEYLKQSSTCVAVTAYNLACAPEMLPRQLPDESEGEGDGPRGRRGGDQANAQGN